jgi:aminocarboxymuconate-semialdehyde decarboxylase
MYYDELVFDPAAVKFVIDSFGATQICIGTDYPFALGDFHPLDTLDKAGIDGGTLAAISSTNAKRFLGLS